MASEEQGDHIYQNHHGSGDNVREKYVNIYRKIVPESLQKPIELILSSIREKKVDAAITQLEVIKATGSLDADSEAILDMLSIHLDLLKDEDKSTAYESLNSFLKRTNTDLSRDICMAFLLRLDSTSGRIDDSRERYEQVSYPGVHTNEAFYELIANNNELKDVYDKRRINLVESELNGIVRGALRNNNSDLALIAAMRLNDISPSLNSRILLLISKASTLNTKLDNKQYWCISASLRDEIIDIAEESVTLIDESKGTDNRVFNVAVPTLFFMVGEHSELSDVCWKYIDQVEEVKPAFARTLRKIYAKDTFKLDNSYLKLENSMSDEKYREKILRDILSSKNIIEEDFAVLSRYADSSMVKEWVTSGGTVLGENKLESDFANLQLMLLALTDKDDFLAVEKIRVQADMFVKKYEESLHTLNPLRIIELTELLNQSELFVNACDFLKPLLPEHDLWVSPLVHRYLNSLLESQQMMTLSSVLSNISSSQWNSFVWIVQARKLDQVGDKVAAIKAVERSIELDSNSLSGWSYLTYLHRSNDATNSQMAALLRRVPDDVLSKKSNAGIGLLIEIAKYDDFSRAERLIVSWFISDPNGCAIPITNFEFNLITRDQVRDQVSNQVDGCRGGFRFKRENVEQTKLLIDVNSDHHQCLMNIGSPLGKLLSGMEVGETKQLGMNDITLIEKLPPYVAVFRISAELRQVQNDGSDCFYSLSIPENPNELFDYLENKLRTGSDWQNRIRKDPSIPLLMKGNRLQPNNPFKAALEQLSSKETIKHNLPNFGEEAPSQVIIDVYTIAFLVMTGLVHAIDKVSTKFILTNETKSVVDQWLTEINRENYLTIGIGKSGLLRQTAEDIKKSTKDIQEGLKLILNNSPVIHPLLVDMPLKILKLKDVVDFSVYTSMKLSISNNISWLCIDEMFAHLFNTSGWNPVNSVKILGELGETLTFDIKKNGLYMHAAGIIPYPLTYNDLVLMSKANDEYAHYFLADILWMYPAIYPDTPTAISFLSSLLVPVLSKAYTDGEILKGLRVQNPRNSGYAEKVFNACCYLAMQQNDGKEAELKFAMLLSQLFRRFRKIPKMLVLIALMASEFAAGHFMSFEAINFHIESLSK